MRWPFHRDGLALNVDEAGAGADFVWQHGLCGDAAQPAEVFPDEAAFRRITLECRGHGHSPLGNPDAVSIAAFTDDLAALIEAKLSPPVSLGGISLGAAIALRLAVVRPELVRALVLARPAWVADAAPHNMQPYAEVGRLLSAYPASEARARFEASTTAAWLAKEGPDNLASLRGFFTREPQAATSALLTRIAGDGPGVKPEDIRTIGVPTLVLGQERDPLHPIVHAEELAALIGSARHERLTPKAGNRAAHVADFSAALRRFLDERGN